MKRYQKTVIVFVMMMSAALFAACPGNGGNNTENDTDPAVLSIDILDANGEAFPDDQIDGTIGGTVRFTPAVQVKNDASQTVTWKVTGGNGNSSIQYATLSIAADETHGTILTVTVTSTADTSKSASIKVRALNPDQPPPATPYAINIGTFTGGSVTVQGGQNQAEANTTVTLNIAPNSGYILSTLTVTHTVGGTSVTVNGSGSTRNFTMPAAAVTVSATFAAAPTYLINIPQTPNGTVTANKTSASSGDTIILTITPNNGYTLNMLTVTRVGTGVAVTVNNGTTGNTRTFTMPPAAVTVNATFTAIGSSTDYFSDNFDESLCSFFDKFNGTSLDMSKWGYQNGNGKQPDDYGNWWWGNNELQSYHPNGVTVADGKLSLTLFKQARDQRDYTSGKIVTANSISQPGTKFGQTYGRFEAKMRLTKAGGGLWPAFWMMPVSSFYGGWPRSGEIDIMEMKGNEPDKASSTIHVMPNWQANSFYGGAEYMFENNSDFTQWHVYGVEWSAGKIEFLIDGKRHVTLQSSTWNTAWYSSNGHPAIAPFDKDFHLIFNLAFGGTFSGGGVDDSMLPVSLEVDWVRAYTPQNNPWPITGNVPSNLIVKTYWE